MSTVVSCTAGQPKYIQRIINCLTIAEKQVYVLFSPTDAKAPKERDGSAAQSLCSKLNALLKPPTNDASTPADVLNPTICALHFTDHNTVLLEFDSANVVKKFGSINSEHHLLTTHICPSAVILPHSYWVILHFIPCTGSFNPQDMDHLTQIEEDMNLPPHSIITATWIKKPELRSLGQKTANIKLVCALAEAANKLLSECLFVANTRVVVSKDVQEPIRCDNCQEYGHIKEKCISQVRCASCACEHTTVTCPTPIDPHCVSCGPTSNHASTNRSQCPIFAKLAANLDTWLPENTMPFFPVLNQNWTFVMSSKLNAHVPFHPHSNAPNDPLRPTSDANPPRPRVGSAGEIVGNTPQWLETNPTSQSYSNGCEGSHSKCTRPAMRSPLNPNYIKLPNSQRQSTCPLPHCSPSSYLYPQALYTPMNHDMNVM